MFVPLTCTSWWLRRGIPFAEAPVGRLRWEAPEANGRWVGGYLDATQYRPFCPQYDPDARQVLGEEDCLYLNVYTPLLPSESPSPWPLGCCRRRLCPLWKVTAGYHCLAAERIDVIDYVHGFIVVK